MDRRPRGRSARLVAGARADGLGRDAHGRGDGVGGAEARDVPRPRRSGGRLARDRLLCRVARHECAGLLRRRCDRSAKGARDNVGCSEDAARPRAGRMGDQACASRGGNAGRVGGGGGRAVRAALRRVPSRVVRVAGGGSRDPADHARAHPRDVAGRAVGRAVESGICRRGATLCPQAAGPARRRARCGARGVCGLGPRA